MNKQQFIAPVVEYILYTKRDKGLRVRSVHCRAAGQRMLVRAVAPVHGKVVSHTVSQLRK